MKKIIPILCVCFLFFIACSDKKKSSKSNPSGPGDILLSLSSVGVNFLDFPFTVKSIMLAHESGKNIELTEGFSINLANVGDQSEYILTKHDVPAGIYTRIVINLAFTDKNKVTYFDSSQSDKPVTTYLISQTGKKLGVDHKSFMINMPFFGKDLSVQSGATTHLDIAWNLNASTEVMAPVEPSSEGWLIEFKPLVQARAIEQSIAMRVQGRMVSSLGEGLVLQSPFEASDSGQVTVLHKNAPRFTLNGKETDLASAAASVNAETYVRLVAEMKTDNGKPSLSASVVDYFEKSTTLLKGLVLAKNSTVLDVFGSKVSSADAITQSKKMYKLPAETVSAKERVYDLFSSIALKMPSTDFDALTAPNTSVEGALQGPGDVVVLGKNTNVTEEKKKDGTSLQEDVFYLTVTEDNLADSSGNSRDVQLLSNNGVTVDKTVTAQLASTITVKWVQDALWRGTGYLKTSGNDSVLVLSTLTAVNAKATNIYKYDFKYKGDSIFDFADNGQHPTVVSELKAEAVLADTNDKTATKGGTGDGETNKSSLESDYTIKITNRLNFSEAIAFAGPAGTINCKSIPTGLDEKAVTFKEGQSTVVFELMQNDESWDATVKANLFVDVINETEFDGDFSTADIIYSNTLMQKWFQDLENVPGKRLFIHSAMIIAEPPKEGTDLSSGSHCNIKPTYIAIRWIREGTILDDYKKAWQANSVRDVGITTGVFLGSVVGAGLLAAAVVGAIFSDRLRARNLLRAGGGGFDVDMEITSVDKEGKAILVNGKEKTSKTRTFLTRAEIEKIINTADTKEREKLVKNKFGQSVDAEEVFQKLKTPTTLTPDVFKIKKIK